jgi:type I restriction enzyme S subunit
MQPKLRFKEFNGDIKAINFGEIFSFHSTNSYSRDCLNYDNGEVQNIHYGDIHTKFNSQFDISRERVPFINPDIDLKKIKPDSFCNEGDLVIADASEDYKDIGKSIEIVKLNNSKTLAGLHTFLARPKKQNLAKGFISFAMQSYFVRHQIMVIAQGTKVLSISSGRLANVLIPIPLKEEQTKIASFLSAVDEKLTQLTKKHELLTQFKEGVMQKIFSQELRFKADDGSDYPDWENKLLGEIFDYRNGKSFENSISEDGSYFLITLNSIDISGDLKKSHHKVLQSDNSLLKDDLVMVLSDVAHGNFLGLSAVIPSDSYVLNQRMAGLRKKDIGEVRFFCTYINFKQKYFKLMGQGSSQLNLSKKAVTDFNLVVPTIVEQTKIANFLSAIDDKIQNIQAQLEATKQYKQGLLQQMFV